MDLHNYGSSLSGFDYSNFRYVKGVPEVGAKLIRKTDDDISPTSVILRRLRSPVPKPGPIFSGTDDDLGSGSLREKDELGSNYPHEQNELGLDSSDEDEDGKGAYYPTQPTAYSILQKYHTPPRPSPGNYVILCPRAPGIFPGQPSSLTDLPFSREEWIHIADMFHVPSSITRTVLRNVAYFASARLRTPAESGERRLQISYTARMADSLPDDLALSSAYLPHARTTYSVMYGCNENHFQAIEKRIQAAGDDADHPLLMVGIFVELEHRRLIGEAERLVDKFTLESDMLEQGSAWDPDSGVIQDHLEICLQSRTLVDHIRTVKRQLAKVSAEIDDLVRYWLSAEYTSLWRQDEAVNQDAETRRKERMVEVARQMSSRVRDIQDEYDDKIDECDKMAHNMSLAMQTGYNQIARRDAVTNGRIARANTDIAIETKRESSQMRYIALLTMIFLPLSCVASVFSTTIFNWEPEDGHPVVSSYGILVLLGVALVLTIATVSAWWFFTWRERKREKHKHNEDPEKGLRPSGPGPVLL